MCVGEGAEGGGGRGTSLSVLAVTETLSDDGILSCPFGPPPLSGGIINPLEAEHGFPQREAGSQIFNGTGWGARR